jgi:hypothetical protein
MILNGVSSKFLILPLSVVMQDEGVTLTAGTLCMIRESMTSPLRTVIK